MSAAFVARLLLLQRLRSNLRTTLRQSLHKVPQQVPQPPHLPQILHSGVMIGVSPFDQKCSDPLFLDEKGHPCDGRAANHLSVSGLARLAVATTQRPQRAVNEYYRCLQLYVSSMIPFLSITSVSTGIYVSAMIADNVNSSVSE